MSKAAPYLFLFFILCGGHAQGMQTPLPHKPSSPRSAVKLLRQMTPAWNTPCTERPDAGALDQIDMTQRHILLAQQLERLKQARNKNAFQRFNQSGQLEVGRLSPDSLRHLNGLLLSYECSEAQQKYSADDDVVTQLVCYYVSSLPSLVDEASPSPYVSLAGRGAVGPPGGSPLDPADQPGPPVARKLDFDNVGDAKPSQRGPSWRVIAAALVIIGSILEWRRGEDASYLRRAVRWLRNKIKQRS